MTFWRSRQEPIGGQSVVFFESLKRCLGLSTDKRRAELVYHALVCQSRDPAFYTCFKIPDTYDGRFDVLVLHLSVFLIALRQKKLPLKTITFFSRDLTEIFLSDMDRVLREVGRGDLFVGREVKTMAAALLGRWQAYERALTADDDGLLLESLARNVYRGQVCDNLTVAQLAKYLRLSYIRLMQRSSSALMSKSAVSNCFLLRR